VTQDPLNRPLPEHLVKPTGSAGDLILASGLSRFLSFAIDMIVVTILFIVSMNLLQPYISHINFCLLFYVIWGLYCVLCALTKSSATIGQKILQIHLYSLFTPKITLATAFARFILMSYPFALFIYLADDLFDNLLMSNNLATNNASIKHYDNYSLLFIAMFLELLILWPFISGNLRNVSWDKTFRCCVIKQRIK
jgi:uncharacterized RDD family membrane protein YckC